MMAPNRGKRPEPLRFSFGLEFEFLVAFREDTGPNHIPVEFANSLGAPMLIPRHERRAEWTTVQYCHANMESAIARYLEERNLGSETLPTEYPYLRHYQTWESKPDGSIRLPNGDEPTLGQYLGYGWIGVEITSPALWNSPGSFREVQAVCTFLQQEYWILTPESCGLHVHIGQGPGEIPTPHLQNIAALLLAADPILAQMHTPSRRENQHCLSNRLFSAVAQGQTAVQALKKGKFSVKGKIKTLTLSTDLVREMPVLGADVDLSIAFPREILRSYPVRPGEALTYPEQCEEAIMYDELNPPRSIPCCVQEILSVVQPQAVAILMGDPPDGGPGTMAYHFANYNVGLFGIPECKKTIEFRQSAGTVDGNEAITYVKIYLGLCEFACRANLATLWPVILKCAQADVIAPESYASGTETTCSTSGAAKWDIFALLVDLGLVQEAKGLQQMLLNRANARPRQ